MAQEIRAKVESLADDDPGLVLKHFGEVESTLNNFTAVANMNMEQFLQAYQATAVYCLESCSSLLHRRMPEPLITQEARKDLLHKIQGWIEEVDQAPDLDDALKRFIGEKLGAIFDAVYHVGTTGFSRVESATNDLVGSVVVRKDIWSRIPSKWVKILLGAAGTVTWTINTALGVQALTDNPDPAPVIVKVYQESTGRELSHGPAAVDRDDGVVEAELIEDDDTTTT